MHGQNNIFKRKLRNVLVSVMTIMISVEQENKQMNITFQYCSMSITTPITIMNVTFVIQSFCNKMKKEACDNLAAPQGCRSTKKAQQLFFYECISDNGVCGSPLMQDEVKLFSLGKPAGSQEITQTFPHTPSPTAVTLIY